MRIKMSNMSKNGIIIGDDGDVLNVTMTPPPPPPLTIAHLKKTPIAELLAMGEKSESAYATIVSYLMKFFATCVFHINGTENTNKTIYKLDGLIGCDVKRYIQYGRVLSFGRVNFLEREYTFWKHCSEQMMANIDTIHVDNEMFSDIYFNNIDDSQIVSLHINVPHSYGDVVFMLNRFVNLKRLYISGLTIRKLEHYLKPDCCALEELYVYKSSLYVDFLHCLSRPESMKTLGISDDIIAKINWPLYQLEHLRIYVGASFSQCIHKLMELHRKKVFKKLSLVYTMVTGDIEVLQSIDKFFNLYGLYNYEPMCARDLFFGNVEILDINFRALSFVADFKRRVNLKKLKIRCRLPILMSFLKMCPNLQIVEYYPYYAVDEHVLNEKSLLLIDAARSSRKQILMLGIPSEDYIRMCFETNIYRNIVVERHELMDKIC